jgi:DNA-directed RNA polymerase specialized sigma24 family protein
MTRAEEFEELRPLLFAIAYRILGSVSEAEDAVQETWLRYAASPAQPTSAKALLSAVVTRVSIDVLRSARVRREEYVGPWFPEPLLTDPVLASVFPWLVRIDVTFEPRELNGQPGAIFRDRDNKVLLAVTLDVLDGRIQAIRSVSNPAKLGHIGPVADAWAVAREVNQARRSAN